MHPNVMGKCFISSVYLYVLFSLAKWPALMRAINSAIWDMLASYCEDILRVNWDLLWQNQPDNFINFHMFMYIPHNVVYKYWKSVAEISNKCIISLFTGPFIFIGILTCVISSKDFPSSCAFFSSRSVHCISGRTTLFSRSFIHVLLFFFPLIQSLESEGTTYMVLIDSGQINWDF